MLKKLLLIKRKYLHVFNISFFVMKDNSMKGDISKNDLIIVKDIKKDLNVNDIIVYNLKGKIKVNKVINIYNDYATGKKYMQQNLIRTSIQI